MPGGFQRGTYRLQSIRGVSSGSNTLSWRSITLLIIIASLGLAGCLGLDDPDRDDRAERALENASEAFSSVDTLSTETEFEMTMDGVRLSGEITGEKDISTNRVAGVMTMRSGGTEVVSQTYTDGWDVYTECPSRGGDWAVETINDRWDWSQVMTNPGLALWALEQGDLEWEGTTDVGGTEVVEIVGFPGELELEDLSDDPGSLGRFESYNFDEIRLFLDSETYLPVLVEWDLEMQYSDDTIPYRAEIAVIEYGEQIDISVPEEATANPVRGDCPGA